MTDTWGPTLVSLLLNRRQRKNVKFALVIAVMLFVGLCPNVATKLFDRLVVQPYTAYTNRQMLDAMDQISRTNAELVRKNQEAMQKQLAAQQAQQRASEVSSTSGILVQRNPNLKP